MYVVFIYLNQTTGSIESTERQVEQ